MNAERGDGEVVAETPEASAGSTSATLPRVGFLGPAGTFSEEALLASALPESIEPFALSTIYDTVTAVRNGDVEWALVPIENSLDGSVTVTLDLLADEQGGLEIVGEALLDVRHSLIAGELLALQEINTVLSHPQVPGQCTHFLRGELAHARVLPAKLNRRGRAHRCRRGAARAGSPGHLVGSRHLRRSSGARRCTGPRR